MEGNNVDIIYLGFNTAFDMVSHYYLLVKIKKNLVFLKNCNYCKYFLTEL